MYRSGNTGPDPLVYRRVVNHADTGPLWLYLYEEEPDDRTPD
jgi:hypothetical protein